MSPAPIRFGNCVVDPKTYEVRLDGRVQPVEPQVFELLSHLLRHPGRLVTKDELIHMVWGGRAVSDAALSSRIKSARRAIGDDGTAQRFIRTVHGRGFCFVGLEAGNDNATSPTAAPAGDDVLDRPAVLVLPFENGTGDARRDYLADGITDDLIAALSAWRSFPIISRATAFVFRRTALPVPEIGRATRARYVVAGRLQQDGARLRVTVELIDAGTDLQIWADRFTRDLGELFQLQEEIAATIVRAVEPELRKVELGRIQRKMPDDRTAWDLAWQAQWHAHRRTPVDLEAAGRLAADAAARDPSWGFPQALLAFVKFEEAMSGWSTADVRIAFRETHEAARTALEADGNAWIAHALSGVGELWNNRDHDRALGHLDRAIQLNPSASYTYHFCGCVSGFAGRIDNALAHQGRVFQVDPAYPYAGVVQADLALWAMLSGDMDQARQHINRAIAADPDYARALQRLAMFGGLTGNRRAAQRAIGQLARLGTFDRAYYDASYPFRDPAHMRLLLEGLRKAGLNLS